MGIENRTDCDYVSDVEMSPSDGVCSSCHGTAYEGNVLDAMAKSLGGQSQTCEARGGSKKCQTCEQEGLRRDLRTVSRVVGAGWIRRGQTLESPETEGHWAIRCAQAGLGTRGVSGVGSGALRSPPTSLRMLADLETTFTSCGSN